MQYILVPPELVTKIQEWQWHTNANGIILSQGLHLFSIEVPGADVAGTIHRETTATEYNNTLII